MQAFPVLRLLAIASLHLPSQMVMAASQTPGCPTGLNPNTLSGTWQADALAHVPGGVAPSLQRLQLQIGDDGRVRAQRDWAALNTAPGAVQGRDRQGQPAFADVQPMIGWIDSTSCRVLLVETEDSGRVSGWLRDASGILVLDLEITQSGPGAVVVLAEFRREGAAIPAPAAPDRRGPDR
jgi:hypothetical protein